MGLDSSFLGKKNEKNSWIHLDGHFKSYSDDEIPSDVLSKGSSRLGHYAEQGAHSPHAQGRLNVVATMADYLKL